MPCKLCNSENLRNFTGELTASFPEMTKVTAAPVYVCRDVKVCLDCGFAEMTIPPVELGKLKR